MITCIHDSEHGKPVHGVLRHNTHKTML